MGMAKIKGPPMAPIVSTFVILALLSSSLLTIEAQVGVCYGRAGTNLPSPQDAVNLCKSYGIESMRIYDLDEQILQAAYNSGLKLIIGVPNDRILSVGYDQWQATLFVQRYVIPYASSIKYIAVGNEVSMDSPQAPLVGPAMQNILNALYSVNLAGQIKVTTAISTNLVINSYPPSAATFVNLGFMTPVANFLAINGSPLLVNVFTYFAYADPGNTGNIRLDYALFTSPNVAFTDPNNGLQYRNLFDAILDGVYAALSKATTVSTTATATITTTANNKNKNSNLGKSNTRVVVSESGWPSKGGWHSGARGVNAGGGATVQNAETYYRNLINHLRQGTPLKPGPMEAYLFELFDENQKPGDDVERNFGLFYSNQQPKYQLNFRVQGSSMGSIIESGGIEGLSQE